jgi:hypothetical protein
MTARYFSCRVLVSIYLFIYLLTSAVNRNINIYKQEDGSGTLTQREPITLVTCQNIIIQNFTTYNLNIKQEYSIILFIRSREREGKNFKIWKNKMTKLSNRITEGQNNRITIAISPIIIYSNINTRFL